MENYSNDMYLSHPTIDFTLLDRPSTSMILARDSVTPFPQGNASFPAFNLFDTEAVSQSNHLVADHERFVLDTHKNLIRTSPSQEFASFPNQSGVRDFFDQSNQLEKSEMLSWPTNEKLALQFSPSFAKANDELHRPFYTHQSRFEAPFHSDKVEQSKTVARVPPTSVGFLNSMAGRTMDYSADKGASLPVQDNSRNQDLNSLSVVNLPPSYNLGPRSSPSMIGGEPSNHPTVDATSHYRNQAESCHYPSHSGAVLDHHYTYNFLGNQKPWQGTIQHPQAALNRQPQILMRIAKPSKLQSEQLQEMPLASPFKQAGDQRQDQGFQQQQPVHFTGTTYSDLLHGPDTPPSQQPVAEDFENNQSILSSQSAEAVVWSGVNGKRCYQGTMNGLGMDQNIHLSPQTSDFREPVFSGYELGNFREQTRPQLASCMVGEAVPEITDEKWKLSAFNQTGRPVLHSSNLGSQNMSEKKTTDLRPVSGWNNEPRKINHSQAKVGALQYFSGQALSKQQEQTMSQAHAFSQSQQLFQERHFSGQRNLQSDPKQPTLRSNVSLPQQPLSFSNTTSKHSMRQSFNSYTNADCIAKPGQLQWSMSSSLGRASMGSPLFPISGELAGECEGSSGGTLQALQPSRGIDCSVAPANTPAHNTKYFVLDNSNGRIPLQQDSPGVIVGSFEGMDVSQSQLYNAPKIPINLEIAPGGGILTKQSSVAVQDFQKGSVSADLSNGRVHPLSVPASQFQGADLSNGRLHPLSVPASQFQGAWKRYIPKQFPPRSGSSDQQHLDVLRPQQGIQHQAFLYAGPSIDASAVLDDSIKVHAPYVSTENFPNEQFISKSSQLLEKRVDINQASSPPTANLMRAVSRHAVKWVPDVMEENQGGRKESVEHQNAFADRQHEVAHQQVNLCAANVSLAHLRGSQPSSSLSPQHFRLGLGPSQDLQPSIGSSRRGLAYQWSSSGELPSMRSSNQISSSELCHKKGGFENIGKEGIELDQGTAVSIETMILQNNATSSSVLAQGPSHVLRESTSSDACPTSSLVSGLVRYGSALLSANPNVLSYEHNTGQEPFQSRAKRTDDMCSDISQVQTSSSKFASLQDGLNGFTQAPLSIFSKSELCGTGALPGHKKHLICGSEVSDKDVDGVCALQDCNLSNVSQGGQTCNIPDGLASTGLTTASQAYVLKHPKTTVNDRHPISRILESSQILSSREQERTCVKKQETLERAPSISASFNNWRSEDQQPVQASRMQHSSNDQLNAHRAAQFGNITASPLPSSVQEDGHHLLMSVDGGLLDSLQTKRASQESNSHQHAKSLDSDNRETKFAGGNQEDRLTASTSLSGMQGDGHHLSMSVDCGLTNSLQIRKATQQLRRQQHANSLDSDVAETKVVKNLKKPPLFTPTSSVIRPGVQLPVQEDPRQGKNITGLEQVGNVERSPGSDATTLPESKMLSNFGQNSAQLQYNCVLPGNQLTGSIQSSVKYDSECRSEMCQQFSVAFSKSIAIEEAVGPSEHSEPLKDLGKFDQAVPKPTNVNNLSSTCVWVKHANGQGDQAVELPSFPLRKCVTEETGIPLSGSSQLPSGLGWSIMKEEVIMTPLQVPVPTAKNEACLSLKFKSPWEEAPIPKKRKTQHSLLIPWHIAMAQPSITLPFDREAELQWASALNRVPEKDSNSAHEDNASSVFRAKKRLTLTTESMQRLYPPLPDGLAGGTSADRECCIYSLAKSVLEDACRLVANTNDQAGIAEPILSTVSMRCKSHVNGRGNNIDFEKCTESFMERVKHSGMELARLDCSTSISELRSETQELEKLSIVNRLAKHHGMDFTMDSSDSLFIENNFESGVGSWKSRPQKYVTPVPMPRTLPEGIRCLSL